MRIGRVVALVVFFSTTAMAVPSVDDGIGLNDLRCEAGPCCPERRSICNDGGKNDVLDHYRGGINGCPKNES